MTESFDEPPRALAGDDVLTLTLDGWEGPLDLLLSLARAQKVDLAKLSILALVDQYLAYIANARALKLELAADYLVMAAWLAYLKSCLLLPAEPEADPDPHELAAALQWRLQRLEAMREAGARLMAHDQLGREVFARARPEGIRPLTQERWRVSLFDLISGYGAMAGRAAQPVYEIRRRAVMALDEAIARLEGLLGRRLDWTELARFLPPGGEGEYRRSALASTFVAALELTRQGRAELSQGTPYGPLLVRAR